MHYDKLRSRVLAAVRSAPNGVGMVYPDGGGAWIAQCGDPGRTAVFPTQESATAHIRKRVPPTTPIIIIDL